MRKTELANGEYYHVYNRGVDKREIFSDKFDLDRFFSSMKEFNTLEPIGSIYENSFNHNQLGGSTSKLVMKQKKIVDFVCYCLNPNHYHFLLKQLSDNGIEKFLHRLGTGYTMYFNNRQKRSGSLFQGRFKAIHIDTNEYLLHLSSYINQNGKVHKINSPLHKSSLGEYLGNEKGICNKGIILEQFKNTRDYEEYMKSSLDFILENKEKEKDLRDLLFE